jgi:hypothetical protein
MFKSIFNKLLNKLKTNKDTASPDEDPLDERNQETSSPYGKYVSTTNEPLKVSLDGTIETNTFEKGTLVSFLINGKAVSSKFISK